MGSIAWAKIAQTALGLLRRFWYAVPIIALTIALMLTRGTLDSTKQDRDKWKNQTVKLEERNKTTQTSLDGALGKIDELNRLSLAAADRFQDDRIKAAANQAALTTRYKITASRVSALEASAKAKPLDPCKPSALAVAALKDL